MAGTELKKAELALAQQLIDGLRGSFEPTELQSDYRRDLRALLEAKLRGEEIVVPEPEVELAPVVDLLEALKASVAAARTKGADEKRPAKTRTRTATGSRRKA